jgi:hypothetical protein
VVVQAKLDEPRRSGILQIDFSLHLEGLCRHFAGIVYDAVDHL